MRRFASFFLVVCWAMSAFAQAQTVVTNALQVADNHAVACAARRAVPASNRAPQALSSARQAVTVQIEAAIYSIEYDTSDPGWYIVAQDEESNYQVRFFYASDNRTDPAGTYATDDFDLDYSFLYDYTSGEQVVVRYRSVAMTLQGSLQAGFDLTATIEGEDGKTYRVHATRQPLPEVTNTVQIVASNLTFDEQTYDATGTVYAMAQSANYMIIMALYPTQPDYTNAEYHATAITAQLIGSTGYINPNIADALLTTRREGRTTTLTGYIFDWDGTRYELQLTRTIGDPTASHTLTFPDLSPIDFTGTEYVWTAEANLAHTSGTPDGYDRTTLQLAIRTTSDLAGTYTDADIDMGATVMRYFAVDENVYPSIRVNLVMVENVEVTYDQPTGYHRLTASLLTAEGVQYNVSLTGLVGLLPYDAREGSVDRTFSQDDPAQLTIRGGESGAGETIFFDIETATDLLGLQFFLNASDARMGIPAGTYPITDERLPGTVLAGAGINSAGNPTYSLYATLAGTRFDQLYFLTSGTVEVTHRDGLLCLTIEAHNSAGVPVHITSQTLPTALEQPEAQPAAPTKIITPEGHLQIIRGERIYDATGARLQ